MAVKQNTGTKTITSPTYNVGSVSRSQYDLNNSSSGTDANAIYYATHQGSGGTAYNSGNTQASNPGSYVDYKATQNVTVPKTDGGGNGGGKGGGTGTGTGTGATTTATNGGGYDYANMIAGMLEQQRAAARSAYDASMSRLNDAWSNTQSALSNNLDSTLARLERQYNYSQDRVNNDAAKSLREAYVNYMLNKKNLNQNLSAAGLSGGATESTMANMYNNYGNNRNDINSQLADNISSLLNEYQNNTASASQLYNTQFADAMNNYVSNINALEQALANNMMSTYSGSSLSSLASYANALNNLNNSGAYTPTTNNYGVDNYTTTTANNTGTVTDYAKYLAMVNSMKQTGTSNSNIITALKQSGADLNTIYSLLGA